MHLSELVFQKKKIFYFLLVAVVFGGILSFMRLSKLEDPEIAVMMANVITVYPGASAHEVEMQVTHVLEDELAALADINSITSRSEANVSYITVALEMSVPQKEIPQRWEFLRRKLELAMPKLPAGVQTPMVFDDVGDVYGMFYAMVADAGFSYEDMNRYARFIKSNLLEVKGVRKASLYGEQKPEIQITLSAERMSELGILPLQIFAALNDRTKAVYAGNLFSGTQQLRVGVSDGAATPEDIGNILITAVGGSTFRLGDVATVEKSYGDPQRNILMVDNQKALGIGLSMESGENIVEVGKRVEARLAELEKQIPAGISFQKVFFQPEKVNLAINGFMWNLAFSVLIVILVLIFTMGFRGGLIIGSGLLLTILATFPLLHASHGTLQRISLGAFIVAMGMLVDNAIVVLDGILIERSRGRKGKKVYTRTAKQTAIPLLGATIIAIAAFFPVFLSDDAAGTYVGDLFVVLAISLSISWILALTQVPLFSAIFLKKRNHPKQSRSDLFNTPLYRRLHKVLEYCMHRRLATLLAFVVVLVAVLFSIGKLDKTFFPDFNYNQCYIEHTLPKGTSPEAVAHNLKQITEHFQSYPEVDMVVTSLGMTPMRYCLVRGMMAENADNYGELIVNFKDYESMQRMRPVFQKYLREQFPEAISRIRKYSLSIKSTHSVEAEFTGPDPKVLKELSNQVQQLMLQNPHVDPYTVCDDWNPKARTLRAVYSPVPASRNNITRSDLGNAILAATDGLPIATVYQGETPYPVRFRVRNNQGKRIEDLNDIPVWSSLPNINTGMDKNTLMGLFSGTIDSDELLKESLGTVPLGSVTRGVKLAWEEPVVRRRNGKRTIQAQCEPRDGSSPAQVQNELNHLVRNIRLPEGYSMRWVGEAELKTEGLAGIISFIPLTAAIMILVLLLLFNDYRRPLIIILCLPMSIIGIVPGLLLAGQPFSFIAIVGVIGLSGMIIKNAIVLLDEIEHRLKKSHTPYRAVVDATISRVRPVIMASLTTILGMIPLLNDPMYGSLAVAIIAGLTVGTLVTLVFVPILYSLFYSVRVEPQDAGISHS